jgi:hypothetical protein
VSRLEKNKAAPMPKHRHDETKFTVFFSNDVDLADVRIDGEDLINLYIDDPLGDVIEYQLGGKQKKDFELDENGAFSFGSPGCIVLPGLPEITATQARFGGTHGKD